MYPNNRFSSPESQKYIIELRQYFPIDLLKTLAQKEIQERRTLAENDYALLQKGDVPTILQNEYDSIEKNHRLQIRGSGYKIFHRIIAWHYTQKAKKLAQQTIKKQILTATQDNYWAKEENDILEDVPDQIIVGWLEAVMTGTSPNQSAEHQLVSHEFTNELYPAQKIPDATKYKTWTDYIIRHTATHLDPLRAIALLKHFLNNVQKAAIDEDILLPYHRRLSINSKGTPIITLRYNEK